MAAVGCRLNSEICFLPGRLRWTLLPTKRYADSLSGREWDAGTLLLGYRRPLFERGRVLNVDWTSYSFILFFSRRYYFAFVETLPCVDKNAFLKNCSYRFVQNKGFVTVEANPQWQTEPLTLFHVETCAKIRRWSCFASNAWVMFQFYTRFNKNGLCGVLNFILRKDFLVWKI